MKQQIIVSGLGGQGAVTLTRLLGEAALSMGFPVITSETHGMAQRGGTVVSMVKVGPFRGPMIPAGAADVGLFLHAGNLAVHGLYLKAGALVVVNSRAPGPYKAVDAQGLAAREGLPPVSANLVLLGFALGLGELFCSPEITEKVLVRLTPPRFLEESLTAWRAGLAAGVGLAGKPTA
jgi:indolepyruvate ferredoxin oxidoreductase beta subunit